MDEIFYGGARGGGKTDGMLGKFAVKSARYGEHCVGVFFRRSREDLKEAIERSRQIYGPIGAKWHEQKKWWTFPSGARLKFEYLDRDQDADNYQGHNYTDVFFEELTHWASPVPVNKLRATLRSAVGVPCQFHATGNPGGPGHQWVRARYIDPAPLGWKVITEDFTNPFTGEIARKTRIFIPSRLSDNRYLGTGYVANLYQSGSEQLVRAWLEGDWSVIEGAFFTEWSNAKHIVAPFALPKDWLRFRSADWGSAAPFSVGWWAVVGDDTEVPANGLRGSSGGADVRELGGREPTRVLPRGALVRYREWYGASAPNVGLKLPAEDVADRIKVLEKDDGKISYGVLDPSAFASDGGPSIAERMAARGVYFRRADNARVSQRGAMGGWDQLRARLRGDGDRPGIYVFSTCVDAIRTIPALQHDTGRPEDVDTDGEDHAADEVRYACMSRPYVARKPDDTKPTELIYEVKPDGRVTANMSVWDIVEMKRKAKERK